MNLDVTNKKIEGPMGGPLSPDEPPPRTRLKKIIVFDVHKE